MTSPERREEIIIYNILMRPNRSFTELLLLSYHIEAWLRKGDAKIPLLEVLESERTIRFATRPGQ